MKQEKPGLEKLFRENFKQATRLAQNLQNSLNKTSKHFPLSAAKLESLTQADADQIELVINRFGKLQDMLSSKIFRGLIVLDFEDAGSMRDTLNKMEKKNIITNADDWAIIREVRNNIIHEYIPEGEQSAATLNEVAKFAPILLQILEKIAEYAENKLDIKLNF